MNMLNNIAALQGTGPASPFAAPGQAPAAQDLLSFLNAILTGISPQTQTPQGLDPLTEKIADQLASQGLTADKLKNMPVADVAKQISALLQQQPAALAALPPELAKLTPDALAQKLAPLVQQAAAAPVAPGLTQDLTRAQAADAQEKPLTKNDVVKKIARLIEDQSGPSAVPTQAFLTELKNDIAELKAAPGTLAPQEIGGVKAAVAEALDFASVARPVARQIEAELKTAATTTPAPEEAKPETAQILAKPLQKAAQKASDDADASAAETMTASAKPPKSAVEKTAPHQARAAKQDDAEDTALRAPQQQQPEIKTQAAARPHQDVTAKIAGMSVDPQTVNAAAQDDGDMSQNSGDSRQNMTSAAALLRPLDADALQKQSDAGQKPFTNYLSGSNAPVATMQSLGLHIQRNAKAGIDTMTIQLDPAELGKLNVRLKFDKDGGVRAHMTTDRPETLSLLQKDASHLTRALQESGFKTEEGAISFDLRQQGGESGRDFQNFGQGQQHAQRVPAADDYPLDGAVLAHVAVQSYGTITPGRVNITV